MLGEFHKNRNNSTVFEELSVEVVDLTVANIRLTAFATVKSTIDISNSSNTVLLFLKDIQFTEEDPLISHTHSELLLKFLNFKSRCLSTKGMIGLQFDDVLMMG